MPKPMLNMQKSQEEITRNPLSSGYEAPIKGSLKMGQIQKDKILRRKRSQKYTDAIHKLDAGGHVHNQEKVNEIIEAIKEELPDVDLGGELLGIVSKCYLGKPYEVHTLDFTNNIVEHYVRGQALPNNIEKARSLAMNDCYDYVEVYDTCCRAVSFDGTVSVVVM
jgi:hypothetical protein